jgi:hypothetical protein
MFDLFLAVDGLVDELELFVIHKAIDFVLLGEALDLSGLVLRYPPLDTGCRRSRGGRSL